VDYAYGGAVMPNPPPTPEQLADLAFAMGMVSAQANCTLDEALVLMSDRAIVSQCTVYEIALAVVDRSISFDD
jgi:hypothetical protein